MKWVYYKSNDELHGWNSSSGKPVAVIIDYEDIEIHIDSDGEIQEVIIARASEKLDMDEIEAIAEIVDDFEITST